MGRRTRTGEEESQVIARSGPADHISAYPPDLCGDFNIRIDRHGTWYYRGTPIGRHALVKLFSKVLRRDEDGVHWLTTPVENGRIEVEDSAFIAVELLAEGEGQSQIVSFRTNVDDVVPLDADHPLRVSKDEETGEPRPYIYVRKGLEARIIRSAFYHLVEKGHSETYNDENFGVWSGGTFFSLGALK